MTRTKPKKCEVEGCAAPPYAKGWCSYHYNSHWKHGDPLHSKGSRRVRSVPKIEPGTLCSVEGCDSSVTAKGLCRKHYGRIRKHGDPLTVKRGPKGQGSVKRGYVYLSFGGRQGQTVLAHRHIMEKSLGRPLVSGETVHHKNGVRSDNRLTQGHELLCPSTCCNLELWSKSQPAGQRVVDKVAWAQEIIRLYGSSVGKPEDSDE